MKQWLILNQKKLLLGESLFWHPREQLLYGVDIAAKEIWRVDANGTHWETWQLTSEPGCIVPAENGLVLALREGIFFCSSFGSDLALITTLNYNTKKVRANDGKCDHWGRLWLATVDETKSEKLAALYCIDARNSNQTGQIKVDVLATDILTGNGIAFDKENHFLYFADTPTHQVLRWSLDDSIEKMRHQGPKVFSNFAIKDMANISLYQGRPDGAVCDATNSYWVACYEGGQIKSFDEQGRLLESVSTPALCPTISCFGGGDLTTQFVATASKGRTKEELTQYPDTGHIFFRKEAGKGIPTNLFKGYKKRTW